MIDTRNSYRAVWWTNNYWRLEMRRWWWPFWTYFDVAADEDRALKRCIEHANYKRRVIHFGKLPAQAVNGGRG